MLNPQYYIWLNVDEMVKKGLVPNLKRVSKYARNIFIFDHPTDFSTMPHDIQYALGAECFLNINFDKEYIE